MVYLQQYVYCSLPAVGLCSDIFSAIFFRFTVDGCVCWLERKSFVRYFFAGGFCNVVALGTAAV